MNQLVSLYVCLGVLPSGTWILDPKSSASTIPPLALHRGNITVFMEKVTNKLLVLCGRFFDSQRIHNISLRKFNNFGGYYGDDFEKKIQD